MNTQTQYSFVPNAKFLSVATQEEIESVMVYPVVNEIRCPLVFKKKSDVSRFVNAGFKVDQISARIHVLSTDNDLGTIKSTIIGPMIIIDSIEDKYNDNNGAYQVAHGRDALGNIMCESNMYDPSSVYVLGPV